MVSLPNYLTKFGFANWRVILSAAILFFVFLAIYLFYFPARISGQSLIFLIKEGESLNQIAQNLAQQGLIRFKYGFIVYAALRGYSKQLQAGNYDLRPTMNIVQIAEALAGGQVAENVVTVLIPEGFRLKEIEERLNEVGLNAELSQYKISDFSKDYDFLKDVPQNFSLEGYLFPDTYKFKKDSTVEEAIHKFLANFDRKLTNQMRQDIKNQNRKIFDIVIMASMIEKEVPDHEERKIVSGILWKRLKNNIGLQVDATIAFITGKKTTQLTQEDLKVNSPYNTYRYRGLPPGPIANPGRSALEATIYPVESQYWYYLSKRNGETVFSVTLEEHNRAKAKYLR